MSTERLPPIPPEDMSPAQRAVHDAIVAGPRGSAWGPFNPMLRSPGLTERLEKVGEYLRYGGALPQRLRELAILVTGRHWDQPIEWFIHAPVGLKCGLSRATLQALAEGRRPEAMAADEQVVHDLCVEVHTTRQVTDSTWAAAVALLGEAGVVDLLGICGYYAGLAMLMNAARTALPEGATAFAVPDER